MTVVVLQPSEATAKDTWLQSDSGTTNYGVNVALHALGSPQIRRSLIQFDLSSIPPGSVINSAILTLYKTAASSQQNIHIHRALTDWFEGDANAGTTTINGSTYNLRNHIGSVAWGAAGGQSGVDFAAVATALTTVTLAVGAYNWTVTADVAAFVAGSATNRGWWVINNGGTTNQVFASSTDATASFRPKLTVDYDIPGDLSATLSGTSSLTASLKGVLRFSVSMAGTSTMLVDLADVEHISVSMAGSSTMTATLRAVRHASVLMEGTSTFSARLWSNYRGYTRQRGCNPVPLLGITDGGVKENGQLNQLSFLSQGAGFILKGWRPQVTQYKDQGRYSNGPLAQGRRLRYRNFANAIEVFELGLIGYEQDLTISYMRELMMWQEAAADYWVSDYVIRPIYLFAKAARETNIRYAVIHTISVPELENPYSQPFFSDRGSFMDSVSVRIERGHWLSTPPGEFECVPVSSTRSWTVSGWESGS